MSNRQRNSDLSLGFDMGRKFGYALHGSEGMIASGVWDLGKGGDGYRELAENICKLVPNGSLKDVPVCIEPVTGKGGMQSVIVSQAKYTAIIEFIFDKVIHVAPSTLKKFAVQYYRACKEEMYYAALKCWPKQLTTEPEKGGYDHADALWLAEYCHSDEWMKEE